MMRVLLKNSKVFAAAASLFVLATGACILGDPLSAHQALLHKQKNSSSARRINTGSPQTALDRASSATKSSSQARGGSVLAAGIAPPNLLLIVGAVTVGASRRLGAAPEHSLFARPPPAA